MEIEKYIDRSDYGLALDVIKRQSNPKITENTSFKMLSGFVFANCTPQKLADARECFEYCVKHKFEDLRGFRTWYMIEKDSNVKQLEICDLVINSQHFHETIKHEFRNKKANSLYNQSQHLSGTIDAFAVLEPALVLRNKTYVYFTGLGSRSIDDEYRYTETIAFQLVNNAFLFTKEKELWTLFKKLSRETDGLIEPVTKPVMRFIARIEQSINKENAVKIRGFLNQIKADISRKEILFGRTNERDDALKVVARAMGKTKNNAPH